MRFVVGLSLILLGLLWLAATADLPKPAPADEPPWKTAEAGTRWRRTASGWQRVEKVVQTEHSSAGYEPKIHPLTVAVFQLLASCLALAALPAGPARKAAAADPKTTPPTAPRLRGGKRRPEPATASR